MLFTVSGGYSPQTPAVMKFFFFQYSGDYDLNNQNRLKMKKRFWSVGIIKLVILLVFIVIGRFEKDLEQSYSCLE